MCTECFDLLDSSTRSLTFLDNLDQVHKKKYLSSGQKQLEERGTTVKDERNEKEDDKESGEQENKNKGEQIDPHELLALWKAESLEQLTQETDRKIEQIKKELTEKKALEIHQLEQEIKQLQNDLAEENSRRAKSEELLSTLQAQNLSSLSAISVLEEKLQSAQKAPFPPSVLLLSS